jgi:D-xylose transport system substrate-binding protein
MDLSIIHGRTARCGAVLTLVGLAAAACGSSSTSSTSSGGAASSTSSGSSSGSGAALSVTSFDSSFSVMSQLKSVHDAGKGLVGVILPDTTSSTRYVDFDQPYLKQAFDAAGYSSSDYKIDNAQGNDATELAIAQADITQGATVLVFDPLDSTVGSQIQQLAQSKGVKTISYDRATFTGTNTYYVSFDNVQVGKLIGQGLVDCVTAWSVSSPKVFTLNGGEDVDPNAVSFAQGYNSVIWGDQTTPEPVGKTNAQGFTLVGDQVTPGWDNTKGGTIFQQQFTAHPEINATVEANDGLGNAVIQVLKNKGVAAKKVPATGQDATLQGMQNVLTGYQCGSVYKAVYLEAQDAAALATYLRAGQTPPASLVNSTTSPPTGVTGSQQPASLLTPVWVTDKNMASTVIKDKFVSATALCSAVGAAVCTAAGISG